MPRPAREFPDWEMVTGSTPVGCIMLTVFCGHCGSPIIFENHRRGRCSYTSCGRYWSVIERQGGFFTILELKQHPGSNPSRLDNEIYSIEDAVIIADSTISQIEEDLRRRTV